MHKNTIIRAFVVLSFYLFSFISLGINYILPMDIPAELSANFGELRPNHFHSGVDFKTLQQIGIPIKSIADGYVSRINISGLGYGKALYITHPQFGTVSVYAHLDSYASKIDSVLKEHQYNVQKSIIDFELSPDELPVKQGELVAISGNSGSSGGPHLHFEIRDAKTEEVIDPQTVYDIVDNVYPRFRRLSIIPVAGEGIASNSGKKTFYDVVTSGSNKYSLKSKSAIKAWGRIGIAVKANDYMTGTSNVYGIKRMVVTVDSDTTFEYDNYKFSFDSTRYINSFIDYEQWFYKSEMFMKTFLPANHCDETISQIKGAGYIVVDESRDYNVQISISDFKDNTSYLNFTLQGDSTSIPVMMGYKRGEYFPWNFYNRYSSDSFCVEIPKGALYDDSFIKFDVITNGIETIYSAGNATDVMQKKATIKIKLSGDTLKNKSKYYIVQQGRGGSWNYAGNMTDGEWIVCRSNNLGRFKLMKDTIAPSLQFTTISGSTVALKMSDVGSGLCNWNVYVDGNWAVCYYDNKNKRLTYTFDPKRVKKGTIHTVEVVAVDQCGNETTVSKKIKW